MTAANATDADVIRELGAQPAEEVTSDDYMRLTGESLSQTVDISRWKRGIDALKDYERLENEVIEAESVSAEVRLNIRAKVFPILRSRGGAPEGAGVYRLTEADVTKTQRDVLMNGLVEGVDGNVHVMNTMALQIVQIAVVAVSYKAEEEAWGHRIFKRDIRVQPGADMVQETLELLERRSPNQEGKSKPRRVTDMMRRGVMTYMERQILAGSLKAPWRIGHGNPLAYELLTGAGSVDLLKMSVPVLRNLIEHKKFVFVPSDTTEQHIKTIGDALEPLEYAVICDTEDYLKRIREATSEANGRTRWSAIWRSSSTT
jgi:hypothetical protein